MTCRNPQCPCKVSRAYFEGVSEGARHTAALFGTATLTRGADGLLTIVEISDTDVLSISRELFIQWITEQNAAHLRDKAEGRRQGVDEYRKALLEFADVVLDDGETKRAITAILTFMVDGPEGEQPEGWQPSPPNGPRPTPTGGPQ